jgi:hypothetical protein
LKFLVTLGYNRPQEKEYRYWFKFITATLK